MNIGIYGYGNLGRAVELCARDRGINVVGIFTRRDPDSVRAYRAPVYSRESALDFKRRIDCMLMCGGSYTDLRHDTPLMTEHFNTVDSFDIHSEISQHLSLVGERALTSGHVAIVSAGWDPGLLSLFRTVFYSCMTRACISTFWGRGVSQGHSQAIRRIEGVRRAVEYTVPISEAVILARSGRVLPDTERHRRECYVVAKEGFESEIERQIRSMPGYFEGYRTDVRFISEEEFVRDHVSMPHRGECIAFSTSGRYGEHINRAELSLELGSNPEFTASVMLAYAVAATALFSESRFGAYTVQDIAPRYLSYTDTAHLI